MSYLLRNLKGRNVIKMGKISIAICDNCGSSAEFVGFKPANWFLGGAHNTTMNFDGLGTVKGENQLLCSRECIRVFVGSYYSSAINQFMQWMNEYETVC